MALAPLQIAWEETQRVDQVTFACQLIYQMTLEDMATVQRYWRRQTQKIRSKLCKKRKQEIHQEEEEESDEILIPKALSMSWQRCSLIFREDRIPNGGYIYLDVEKVSLRRQINPLLDNSIVPVDRMDQETRFRWERRMTNANVHFQAAAQVCLVDEKGIIILYAVINWPEDQVCQYHESLNGITPAMLSGGYDLGFIQHLFCKCLKNNTLVGQSVDGDLKSLLVCQEAHRYEDLTNFYRDENNQAYCLKALAMALLPDKGFQESVHSVVQNARITRKLHIKKLEMLSNNCVPPFFSYNRPIRVQPTGECSCP
ncbi:RNA exonuclease 4 [Folsomia candida]|uniref:RNA exonuclease 4 n=1 Tax=Folsomia candida TaxID=158441 RepID=A0A226E7S5_FOLCA|nr:RNA exonuclease 4 [Folsomia candida]